MQARRIISIVLAVLVCAAGLAATLPAGAVSRAPREPSARVERLDGVVLGATSHFERDRIVTDVVLAEAGRRVVVRMDGGRVGDRGMWTEEYTPLDKGDVIEVPVDDASSVVPEMIAPPQIDGGAATSGSATGAWFLYNDTRWASSSPNLSWRLNALNAPSGASTAVDAGTHAWEDDYNSTIGYSYGGATSAVPGPDGANVVSWTSNEVSGVLATCIVWYVVRAEYNEIREFDIEFNRYHPWSTSGSVSAFDVQAVATHELGHTLQLLDLYDPDPNVRAQTMYGYCGLGATQARTIEDGDRAGIRSIYPRADVDLEPPVTSSDVRALYGGGEATITLTAADAGSSGVSATYWKLDGSSTYASRTIHVGTVGVHSVEYWSVDRAFNRGSHVTRTFTVVPGPVEMPAVGESAVALLGPSAPILFGQQAKLAGVLQLAEGVDAAGRPVVLERLVSGAWIAQASTVTGSGGAFAFSPQSAAAQSYRVTYPGDAESAASASNVCRVQVKARITVRTPATVRPNARFKAWGTLAPGHAGPLEVRLYRSTPSGWARTATHFHIVTTGSGWWSLSRALPRGTWRYYVTHADAGHVMSSAWSPRIAVR